jgi:hypothetical protein
MRRRTTDYSAGYREKARAHFGGACERCGEEVDWGDIEVHHVDRDRANDNRDNLENLCHECHRQEHHGDDPMWGMVASLPRPVVEMLDEAVERHGYHSRSEAVARALVRTYDTEVGGFIGGPAESVSCWFNDAAHTKWVSDAVVEPSKHGGKAGTDNGQ